MRKIGVRTALVFALILVLSAPLFASCITDTDCYGGEKCDVGSGECVSASFGCVTDTDCYANQQCDSGTGQCVERNVRCITDVDCGGFQRCDSGSGLCIERSDQATQEKQPQSEGCIIDSDCAVWERCSDGSCVAGKINVTAKQLMNSTIAPKESKNNTQVAVTVANSDSGVSAAGETKTNESSKSEQKSGGWFDLSWLWRLIFG